MKVVNGLARGVSRLAGHIADISKDAQRRVRWFDYYQAHDHNARLTCRHFGINPETFYRWNRRCDPHHLESLEDRSHRPKHVRQPTASAELVAQVLQLREQYPKWGKDKLVVNFIVETPSMYFVNSYILTIITSWSLFPATHPENLFWTRMISNIKPMKKLPPNYLCLRNLDVPQLAAGYFTLA